MSLRVYCGALGAEVNAFAPLPTDEAKFNALARYVPGTAPADPPMIAAPLRPLRELAGRGEVTLIEGPISCAQPGGVIPRETYQGVRDELLSHLQSSLPLHLVVLGLHGATSAQGVPDCDGDLVSRVRAIVGPTTTIGVLLDAHCHVSPQLFQAADLLTCYKEYPHTDVEESAARLVRLTLASARGEIRPVKALVACGMQAILHTTREPVTGLVRWVRAQESSGRALDLSIGHGFPWGDSEHAGVRVWATTDGDAAEAEGLAFETANRVLALRGDTRSPLLDAAAAIRRLQQAPASGLVVIADSADNPGGGAPSDATYLTRACLEAQIGPFAAGVFYDPIAVAVCEAAGVGARLPLRVGGKISSLSGPPLDFAEVTVLAIQPDAQQAFGGGVWPMGTLVGVQAGPAALVLSQRRVQCFDPAVFAEAGIDLAQQRAVLVKSSQHFHAAFAPLAAAVLYVEGDGALGDFTRLPYVRTPLTLWPHCPAAPTAWRVA